MKRAPAAEPAPRQKISKETSLETAVRDVSDTIHRLAEREKGGAVLEHAPPRSPWFRGRKEEIVRGLELLRSRRVVVLTGVPGIGKTEVALAIGEAALQQGPGTAPRIGPPFTRALWLPLESLPDIQNLGARFAMALDQGSETRNEGRGILLVIDLVDDLSRRSGLLRAPLEAVLREWPGLRVLIAARAVPEGLTGDMAAALRIEPLSPAESLEVFQAVAGSGLDAGGDGSQATRALVEALAGYPLSLVLVAKRVAGGQLSAEFLYHRLMEEEAHASIPPELLEPIDGEAGPTAEGRADAKQRARRLAASMQLAIDPLFGNSLEGGPGEMFAWLGHLPDGLPRGLAPYVFGPEADRSLSLLVSQRLAEVLEPDQRVSLPAPLRWYARHRAPRLLNAQRRLELLKRTLVALTDLLETFAEEASHPGARAVLDAATREEANLEALIGLVPERVDGQLILPLAEAVAGCVSRYIHMMMQAGQEQGLEVLGQKAVDLAERLQAPGAAAVALHTLGQLYVETDRPKEAEAAYQKALDQLKRAPAPAREAGLYKATGDLCVRADRLTEAAEAYQRALPILETLARSGDKGWRLEEAELRLAIGTLAVRSSQLAEAEESFNAALTSFRALGNQLGEADALQDLGELYGMTDRIQEAETAYKRALELFIALPNPLGEADTRRDLGDLYLRTDRLTEAEACLERALHLYRSTGARLGEANAREALADFYLRTDRMRQAETSYLEALALYREVDDRLGEANALRGLGDVYLATDRLEEARNHYREGLELYVAIGEHLGEANTLLTLGDLATQLDQLDEAEELYDAAMTRYRAMHTPLGEANALLSLGEVHLRASRLLEAEDHIRKALASYQGIEDRLGEANALRALGELHVKLGRLDEAEEACRASLDLFRTIEAHLGEANAFRSLGKVALARKQPATAFRYLLEALRTHEAIDDLLEAGSDLRYLARAALLGGDAVRAAVLAGRSLELLRQTGTPVGRMHSLEWLGTALAATGDQTGSRAAAFMALEQARALNHPSVEERAKTWEALRQLGAAGSQADAEVTLTRSLATCEARLKETGTDPYGPLAEMGSA